MPELREFDWSLTPLGPREQWPAALKTAYDIMMTSKFAMCATWGPELTLLYNEAYARFLGLRHPAALGQRFDVVWADVWPEIGPMVAQVLAGEAVAYEDLHLVMTRNGYAEDTWWTFSYSPLRDGDAVAGLLNVASDSTDKIVAQRRLLDESALLRESERRFRALMSAGGYSVYRMNADWQELRTLDSQGMLTEPDGPGIKWLETYIDEADRPGVLAAIADAIARKGPFELEHRVRMADGGFGWVLSRAIPILDDDGEILEWFGAAADITARREAEAQLRAFNEILEDRVQERTRELLAAESQLRQMQKMEAIGQLTGGVAHDFNNLLTVIRSSAELLRRRELPEERRRRYLDAISDTADRAAKLTGQLLAFARRQALKPETFDAAERVAAIAEMLRTVVGSRIELVVDARCDLCFVDADISQFETSLVNLTVNARDAMSGEGRLVIAIDRAPGLPALRGHAETEGDFVAVTVTDTGAGIAPENLERIFEPFFTTKEIGKGTGLGLSQVYGFAKQSGGDIGVTSRPGEGTAFTLYLPRSIAPAETFTMETEIASSDERGCVLVVEDNAQVGDFVTQLLKDLGYETRLAANAATALAVLEEARDRFDVVFTDVVMPGISGVDLGRRIRLRWPGLPVVLTSGYSHVLAEDTQHGFPLLRKPYSVDELYRILQSVRR